MNYQNFEKIFAKVNGEKVAKIFAKSTFENYRTFYGNISEADAYAIAREFKNKNERGFAI